ncbi:MAG: PilN domain-containing protein [Methylicorpusculum sp.]|nr:PilN domain-containing protein [Methylicorpusculum sp.]
MLNLDANIDLDVKKFFRWWGGELLHLLPDQLKQILDQQQGQLVLRPYPTLFSLSYEQGDACEDLGEFSRDADGIEQIKSLLLSDNRFENVNLVFRLTGLDAVSKEFSFPLAAAENLQQVLAYELDRFTPFNKDQVYFAIKLLEKNKQTGLVRLILVLSPRDKIDALIEELNPLTIRPSLIDYDSVINDRESNPSYYNLLPEDHREKKVEWQNYIHGSLTALFFILLAVFLVLPLWLENQAVSKLREEIAVIEKEATVVDQLQAEIDSTIAQTKQLITKKQQSPSVGTLLNSLSALIKDDTWLNYLKYSDGQIQIQGQSPAASALIAILEGSDLFANARFVSPVTQDRMTGLERFQLTVDVKSRSSD